MISLRDKGLKNTFEPMAMRLQQGQTLQKADVEQLIRSAQDGPSVTQTERKDLDRILNQAGDKMAPEARAMLANFVTAQGQAPGGGTVNLFDLHIKNASIRKALDGEHAPAILADRKVDNPEAQRLLAIVNDNGVISGREKRDLRALLLSPDVVIEGTARRALEQAAGVFTEPPPHLQKGGAAIPSQIVDSTKTYRVDGLPFDLLEKAGVPAPTMALMRRADTLTGTGDKSEHVTIDELVALEQNAALLPAEKAALGKVWQLMEVTPLETPTPLEGPAPLAVQDHSVRPGALDVTTVPVDVAALPQALQTAAQRAVLIAKGAGADLSMITAADVQYAIEQDPGASTPADRQTFADALLPAVKGVAISNTAPAYSASVTVPAPGTSSQEILNSGDIKLNMHSSVSYDAAITERGFWTYNRPWANYYPHNAIGSPPSSIPKSSQVALNVSRTHELDVNIPAGTKLVLVQQELWGNPRHVLEAGRHPLPQGRFRAMLMKDGEILQQTALDLRPANEKQDLSPYYGFAMKTPDGGSLALQRTNKTTTAGGGAHTEKLNVTTGGSHTLPGGDKPVTLAPGRYAGAIDLEYNQRANYVLDVMPNSVLEAEVNGVRTRLFPVEASPTVYEGALRAAGTSHQLLRFDPKENKLWVVNERLRESHGSSGMSGTVESRGRTPVLVSNTMRVG